MTRDEKNKLVFHYCSIDTFFAIISNKTLRLSDVIKSNDNLEVCWMKKILLNIIEKESLYYEEFNDFIKETISFTTYKYKIKEKAETFFDEKELKSKFFVLCFSGEQSEDRLSQWRGYGDDGKGIAIGFDERRLKESTRRFSLNENNSKIEFKKIEYDFEEQKNIVREFWKNQIRVANTTIGDARVDFECWLLDCFSKLYEKAIFMKNSFFKEEDESRLVFEKVNEEDEIIGEYLKNNMMFQDNQLIIKDGKIVEYYELDISKMKKGFLKKVILGPKCTAEKEDVEMLLKRYGLKNVEVVWSKGSYR